MVRQRYRFFFWRLAIGKDGAYSSGYAHLRNEPDAAEAPELLAYMIVPRMSNSTEYDTMVRHEKGLL